MNPPPVTLVINGTPYRHFVSVDVDRSVSDQAGSFQAELADPRGSPNLFAGAPIRVDAPVQIFYGPLLVLTGSIEDKNPSYTKTSHGVQISGRSKTGDLVDSSAKLKNGEAKNLKLDALTKTLLEDYDIGIELAGDVGDAFKVARVIPGEKVHDMLDEYARSRGVLPTDNEKGDLKLFQAKSGAPVGFLIEGLNIVTGRATFSSAKKHSEYEAKGQETGQDEKHGRPVSEVVAKVTDPSVKRHRPLVLMNENETPDLTARQRADWEAAYRGGEATTANIGVVGWTCAPGRLWTPGDNHFVGSPMLDLDRVLVLESVHLHQSKRQGTTAELTLKPVEALNPKEKSAGATGQSGERWVNTKPKKSAA